MPGVKVNLETKEVIHSMTKESLNKQADQLGMPHPTNITEAWRLKQLLVAEARREQIQIDNDTLNGLRIPIQSCSEWIDKVFIVMDTALKKIPAMVENSEALTDQQKAIVRRELAIGIKEIRKTLAAMELS